MNRHERRHGHTETKKKSYTLWIVLGLVALAALGFYFYHANQSTGFDYAPYTYADEVYASPNATTIIEEFGDFQCPACQAFEPNMRAIRDANIGKVRLVFKEFPLRQIHEHAELAAEAAECARTQDKFWAYHDVLYDSKQLDEKSLRLHAKGIGLDMNQWDTCMQAQGKSTVTTDVLEGTQREVHATPTLFINGVQFEGQSIAELTSQIK